MAMAPGLMMPPGVHARNVVPFVVGSSKSTAQHRHRKSKAKEKPPHSTTEAKQSQAGQEPAERAGVPPRERVVV